MMDIMNSKPKVTVSSLDLDRLEALLAGTPDRDFPGKAALQAELDRADVLEPEQMPPDVVTMNSTVRFALQGSDETFSQTLVYPKDADGSADRISILAPVGGALLGLKVGDTIEWPGPGGKPLAVRIVGIDYQPERAGELHR
jgi:regulator of nucleoside diphosphate kinase